MYFENLDLPYGDEYHCEYEILSKQRHDQWRRWYNLDDEEKEHVKTDENRDREGYL